MQLRPILPPLDASQRYSVAEACLYLRQSRAKLYNDIRDHRLAVLKDGARTYVHGAELVRRSACEA